MKKRIQLTAVFLVTVIVLSLFGFTVNAKAETITGAGLVATASGPLNVRAAATSGSAIVAALNKGTYVTIISTSGSWRYVQYGRNAYGYCYAAYITMVPSTVTATVSLSSGTLNVRSGAGTSYAITGSLVNGDAVVIFSQSGSWSKFLYNGTKVGYVNSAYLKPTASAGTTGAISLAVPSYKQNDSRWANTVIAGTGKTIGDIGCVTTALAMTESYRLGETITPPMMASRLQYTSGGAVYWPSVYQFYSGSDYLARIYALLRQNKPVIIGGKTSYGSTHYVVVTGFKGGSLTAANFTINDPGYSARTTLKDQFTYYPTFIKIVYAG